MRIKTDNNRKRIEKNREFIIKFLFWWFIFFIRLFN